MWEDLSSIADSHNEPWSVIGDFNCILSDNERKGGASSPSLRGRQGFRRMVQECNLIDAGLQGNPFTWRKGSLFQRLDRAFINMSWRLRFPQAAVYHLPFFKSDHRAILLQFEKKKRINRNRRPFIFIAAWLTHTDFPNLMGQTWNRVDHWGVQVPRFQEAVKKWNREVFGDIFSRKKALIRQLEHLDNQIVANPSHELESLKRIVWHEYEQVLRQEELLWFQKSRSKWLYFGDWNSRFFHGVTAIRRRKNSFDLLRDANGNWIGDQDQIENIATSYFQDLFAEEGVRIASPLNGAFPTLSVENKRMLSKRVTRSDIYNVIRHMNPFKEPGVDGLQAGFFQSQWSFIGESFCNLILDVFRCPEKVSELNDTLITLIPKVEPVESIRNFIPISLCNVSYKVITKILAQRLRSLMGSLVNPCQSSFIPHRQSRDNIILAQEIFHSMRKRKGKKRWMAIKLDLEKAYDRLSWHFIKETLGDIGLPDDFVNLVWQCISTPRMRMLWNGEALNEFSPSRGIWQGNPLSPYLFVLCIEKLFQMITMAVEHNQGHPIQLSRGGPNISHLAFVDDVLLFAEAGVEQIMLMKGILDVFCRVSGQKVSEEKTRIFFSQNANSNLRQQICDNSGFQVTNDLGKYLGVPILHNRVNRRSFQFILDKVDQRLSNWKVKTLSFAGRLTLTKSVLQSLPSYVMQAAYVPRFICDEIDKKCRSFVWGDTADKKRVHLVNWKRLCSLKDWGGLGLRSARAINQTALMKASWHLIKGREEL